MNQIFFRILNMSIMAGLLSIVVILLRLLFKRVPKWIICLLWAIVALRLIIPFNIESPVSLMPEPIANGTYVQDIVGDEQSIENYTDQQADIPKHVVHPDPEHFSQEYQIVEPDISDTRPKTYSRWLKDHLWMIWAAGAGIMILYACFSFIRLKLRLRASVRVDDDGGHIKVYANDDIISPFLLGLIRPVIYVPSSLCTDKDSHAFRYVIKHEQAHVSRWDHIWKPLGFLLLSINWFNPILWVAYILLCRDIEAACDEKVIKDLAADELAYYSRTLLALSSPRHEIAACPVAFGETGTKSRIKAILNYKKPAFWIIIAAIVICIAAAVCLLTIRPGAKDASDKLMKMYLMETDTSSSIQPRISINAEEQSFVFNWNRQSGISYAEEGHYDIERDRIILHIEKQMATNILTKERINIPSSEMSILNCSIPEGYIEDRTGLSYAFSISDEHLRFIKGKSAPIPEWVDPEGASYESIPDKSLFKGVDVVGTYLIKDGISILDENSSEAKSTDLYVIFGNKYFDGAYAVGWTLARVPFVSDTTTRITSFLYKIEGSELIFAPDETRGNTNSPFSSPAEYSFNSDGSMLLRQWGEDTLLEPSALPWWATGEEYKYYYTEITNPYSADSKSDFSDKTISEIPSGNSIWKARSYSSALGIDIRPAFVFSDVDTAQGSGNFTMSYDPLSSYLSVGEAIISNDKIICSTDDHKYTYVLIINRDGPSISLIFDEAGSAVPDDFTQTIPDGTEFGFADEAGSESAWMFEADNNELLSVLDKQRFEYAGTLDERVESAVPVAVIGKRDVKLGVSPEDTAKFLYLAYENGDTGQAPGWRLIILQVGDPMMIGYANLDITNLKLKENNAGYTIDFVFGVDTGNSKLANGEAQSAFEKIIEKQDTLLHPVALLAARRGNGTDYSILCATGTADENSAICIIEIHEEPDGSCSVESLNRLDMNAYVISGYSQAEEFSAGSAETLPGSTDEALDFNWDTTDSEEMMRNMNNSHAFDVWRYMLTFLPEYSSDDADELLSVVINNGRYCLLEAIQKDTPGGIYFKEEDVKTLMTDIFHISPEAYDHALEQFFEVRSKWDNINYNNAYEEYLSTGLIHGVAAGMPTVGTRELIDSAEYKDGLWYISFHDYSEYEHQDMFSRNGTAVMERMHYNGEWIWTFYSLTRNGD